MYKLSALSFIYGGHYNKSSRPLKLRTARRITHAFPGREDDGGGGGGGAMAIFRRHLQVSP